MRSESETPSICEETDVKVICAVEEAAEEYKDCPAACRKDNSKADEKEDTVVKSGDLLIKATPSTNRRAVVDWISDLDTITLKASEAITLNSVTLERYGYSDGENVIGVWLENADGKEITNHKTLSKDKVTLALKKDYKELDSTDEFTIVVELAGAKPGGTIGFKVTDADASAKNLDISDYSPYTYDLVDYAWAKVTLNQKGKPDTYNYAKGESYEVQRFKAKSEAAAISVYGFTLKQDAANAVDLKDSVEKVEVTVNDEKVSGLKWSINNKDELQINFDEVELAIRETSIFAVNFVFVDGFEDLNKAVKLTLAKSDFNATEKKTWSRVDIDTEPGETIALAGNEYLIRGGKIELTNTKLGTIEAAADTDDVVFGKWEISLGGEAIVLNPFKLTFKWTTTTEGKGIIKNVRVSVDGDETSATCSDPTFDWATVTTVCNFDKNIDVDKDSKVEFLLNITQYAKAGTSIKVTPATYGKATIRATSEKIGKYDDANETIQPSDFIGTIDLNEIKVQTPKAALENTKSKTVEFVQGKSDTQTIFEGKYTAKKKDIYLNSFSAESTANVTDQLEYFDQLSVNVIVNGKKVATTDVKANDDGNKLIATEDFAKVLIEAGESVNVEVEVQAYPNTAATEEAEEARVYKNIEFKVVFEWEDKDGNEAGKADDTAAKFKIVRKGSLSVSDNAYETSKEFKNNSVSLKKSNATIAKFDLKPSKSSTSVDLDEFVFTVQPYAGEAGSSNIRVKVGTNTSPSISCTAAGVCKVTELDETVESNGITVEISTKGEATEGKYSVVLNSVNDGDKSDTTMKTYSQFVMPVQVTFDQKDMGWTTKIIASMDQGDNDTEITKIRFKYKRGDAEEAFDDVNTITSISENTKGETEIEGYKDSVMLISAVEISTNDACGEGDLPEGITCVGWKKVYTILKGSYNDYFRVGDTYLKIFKA